ncbi:MAG: ABC transporter ATP-binding protein, partial [Rhodobacter sp. BACL10 MAG-120910-bin24]
ANSDATEMALRALRAVKITLPEQRMGQYPHELSGGMRQRVMIAMALALKPQILIADEPTTALDVTVQREILDLLRDLKSEFGTAIILITHDMGVVAEMADRVLIMRHGEIVEQGSVRDIFHRPTHSYTQSLLAAVPKIGHGTRQRPLTSDQDEIVAEVRNISVKYTTGQSFWGGAHKIFHAVSDVSFQIKRGETLALVGESGCGKSTVAKALVGLTPFEGSINIGGKSFAQSTKAAAKALRKKVQIVFQDPMAALDPRMMVKALIAEPLVIHNIGTPASRQAEVLDLVLKVGLLEEHLDRYPHEFSGGQRQRICIARALALKPDLIVADEAVSALDVSVQATVLDLLTSLQKEFGIAILFISHDLAVVENICDRVAVMHHGVIVETGTR